MVHRVLRILELGTIAFHEYRSSAFTFDRSSCTCMQPGLRGGPSIPCQAPPAAPSRRRRSGSLAEESMVMVDEIDGDEGDQGLQRRSMVVEEIDGDDGAAEEIDGDDGAAEEEELPRPEEELLCVRP
ncbi:hypothetical protein E3N88_26710 [Mikania micrantha]|uniref:Uncharacterized protein n=1 Tax=Mikania micrantha TaxID=192012 RepID=A0A5N6MUK2_9ASTR|nr:hypothetical protein E3N88_26710 [Mikania micrantha]